MSPQKLTLITVVCFWVSACVESTPSKPEIEAEIPLIARPDPSICGNDGPLEGWLCMPDGRFELGAGGCYGDLNNGGATDVFVTLTRPFWVAERAVSGPDWYALMEDYTDDRFEHEQYDEVYGNISYGAALLYANRLSEAEGLTPCYTLGWDVGCRPFYYDESWTDFDCESGATPGYDRACDGYRLPTIAEREWSLRAAGNFGRPEIRTCRDHPWLGDGCFLGVSEWVIDRTTGYAQEFGDIDYFPPGEYDDPLLHEVLGTDSGGRLAAFPEAPRNVCTDLTVFGWPRQFPASGLRLVRTATDGGPLADGPLQ